MADLSFSTTQPTRKLTLLFWIFLLLNVAFIVWLRTFLDPFSPGEIVRFEVAKTVPVAESIIREWTTPDDTKLRKAIQSIYFDYVFIVLYTAGLSIASIFLSHLTGHQVLKRTGRFMSILVIVAGACDVIENVAMLRSMSVELTTWNVVLTYDMAVTKFSIVILTLIFLAICVVFFLTRIFANMGANLR